ncbi:MAG: HTH-type transcriptional activator IlvY [Alkalispirochaeta sp.]
MTFDELSLVVHLAGTLHFSRTATARNISPSALSRTIQRVEEELGCRLFQRDKRFVALTPAGQSFVDYARDALDRHAEIQRSLTEQEPVVRGEVSLFCSVTAVQSLLNAILPTFRTRYPHVGIHIHTGDSADAVERVLDGTADISVAARPETLPAPLEFHELTQTPLVFIAPQDAGPAGEAIAAFERSTVASGDTLWPSRSGAEGVPFILADRALSRRAAERWFRLRGIRPRIYAEAAGHEAIIAMVHLGFGVGVVPRLVLDQSPLAEGVRILDLTPRLPEYHIGLCAQRRRLASSAVAALWQVGIGSIRKNVDTTAQDMSLQEDASATPPGAP